MAAHALAQKAACLVCTFPFFLSTCSYLKYLPTCLPAYLDLPTIYHSIFFPIAACGLFLKQNIRKERPPIPTSRSWRPFFRESRLPARSLIAAARIASGLGTRRHWFSSFHVGGSPRCALGLRTRHVSIGKLRAPSLYASWESKVVTLIPVIALKSSGLATFAFQNHSGGRCHRLTSQWMSILIEKPRCQNEVGTWS